MEKEVVAIFGGLLELELSTLLFMCAVEKFTFLVGLANIAPNAFSVFQQPQNPYEKL